MCYSHNYFQLYLCYITLQISTLWRVEFMALYPTEGPPLPNHTLHKLPPPKKTPRIFQLMVGNLKSVNICRFLC